MALKKPSEAAHAKSMATPEAADALARQLADKPYGGEKDKAEGPKKAKSLSISLPPDLIEQLEDRVRDNKRSGSGSRTVSALIRELLLTNGYTTISN
ncbi:MAG: hypothetical protein EOO38_27770 [Cytophagaceae bacterium]|nr:MAG: hypothetical protein EOO38_27770 [Cytophagaceae bacterium]